MSADLVKCESCGRSFPTANLLGIRFTFEGRQDADVNIRMCRTCELFHYYIAQRVLNARKSEQAPPPERVAMPKDQEPLFVSLLVNLIDPPVEFGDDFRLTAKLVWRDLLTLGFCYHPGRKIWCWASFVRDSDGDTPRINEWIFTEEQVDEHESLLMADPGGSQ